MDVYLNGKMVNASEAWIGIEDAGFTHAIGLFETMAAFGGQVFRLDEHVRRLIDSAQKLGLAASFEAQVLTAAVQQTLTHNQLDEARVRLTVTPGIVSLLADQPEDQPAAPTVLVVATEPVAYDAAYFEHGIMALIVPQAANPFDATAGHKTLSYWGRLRTLRQAAVAGAGEALWLNVTNHLASGSVSNLFLVKDGQLLTPIARGEEVDRALPAPVLPGITRAVILELADTMGLPAQRRMLDVNDLLNADEVFLTNSSWQVLPVTRVEKNKIGDGKVGPITQQLRTGVLKLIEQECRKVKT
jgi:branched-chain amino acid aminotransferase